MIRIPSEDLYAFNIDHQIESYFSQIGYEVHVVDKPTRREESKLGFDSLFKDSEQLKYFALQHKRPRDVVDNKVIRFRIDNRRQYEILHRNKEWMFYSFPLFVEYDLLKVALYHTVFSQAKFWKKDSKTVTLNIFPCCINLNKTMTPVSGWGEFSNDFISCKIGKIEVKLSRAKALLIEEFPLNNYTSYVFDLDNKKVLIVRKYAPSKNEQG